MAPVVDNEGTKYLYNGRFRNLHNIGNVYIPVNCAFEFRSNYELCMGHIIFLMCSN